MSFGFTSRHISDYHERGYTVFRDLIPAALLAKLRGEADKGRAIARKLHGPNAQRLQPLVQHSEIDMGPFKELALLPKLVAAVNGLFEVHFGRPYEAEADLDELGVLYEPESAPQCMRWHRDIRDLHAGIDVGKWSEAMRDIRFCNQTNIALYADSCLWVVPGSHLRHDTPDEIRRFPKRPVERPPSTEGLDAAAAERVCLDYVRSMPGAEQVHLNAGDYLIYRNSMWHTGFYLPYQKRATVHGAIFTPEYREFLDREFIAVVKAGGAAQQWQNPNANRSGFKEAKVGAQLRAVARRVGRLARMRKAPVVR
jgi:ectoine hydroxylase-related dioxygenase (phytanoyl-CoA dioxygenase family)